MVSNKITENSPKRPYTLKARARQRERVHLRITKAAVHLHGTVGPARTTVSDIAKYAGVRRATVYNHFPTDLDLIDACSSHWFSEHPPPDPSVWVDISDPGHRAEIAVTAMYGYYDRGQEMLAKVLRDASLVPALEEILRLKWHPMLDAIVDILIVGWPDAEVSADGPGRTVERCASIRVALDFFTWQTMTSSGLSTEQAAGLAAGWITVGRSASH